MIKYAIIKKALLFLLLMQFFVVSSAQWITLNSGTSIGLSQTFFVNDSLGYLLGYGNGDIFKTIDAGQSWANPSQAEFSPFIYFNSADTGFSCFGNASPGIYRTTDGATTWNNIFPTDDYLSSISFPGNGNTGYIIGIRTSDSLVVYKTTDRGNNWNCWTFPIPDYSLTMPVVFFTDLNTGYFADWGSGIYKTINGGLSWSAQLTDTLGFHSYWVQTIHFPSPDTGYAVGTDIFRTTDGQHWFKIQQSVIGDQLNSVWFTSSKRGFVVSYSGAIAETRDGGQTWILDVNTATPFNSVHFPSNDVGYACGQGGQLVKYNSPVGEWEPVNQNQTNLYPNPSYSGKYHLSISSNNKSSKDIFVYDMLGNLVYKNANTALSDLDIDLSEDAEGIYLLKVVSEGKVYTGRLVFM